MDISRNAWYLALFRSPSDRKLSGIIAGYVFMNAYSKRLKNRLDTCWWITNPTHQPISKFLQPIWGMLCLSLHCEKSCRRLKKL